MPPKAAAESLTVDAVKANIDAKIAALDDWRGNILARVRALVHQAVPEVIEEWKWDIPVWSHAGILCTGEVYKQAVKLTFPKGASLDDPAGLFNASLEGKVRRALDITEDAQLDEAALIALLRTAAAFNEAASNAKPPSRARKSA
jgi:hypothetical protein